MSEALEVMDGAAPVVRLDMRVAADPRWDRARELLAQGRRVAMELAAEIGRLREFYLRDGQGRRTDLYHNCDKGAREGFQARLREQLGLHPEQARRILQEAEYQERIALIAAMVVPGEVIEVPGKGREAEPVEVEVTPRMIELAREARESWGLPAAPKASRQWAGIAGESHRVDVRQEGSPDRAPCNHARNIVRAVKALATSLERWEALDPEERRECEHYWNALVDTGLMPSTWRAHK